MTLFWCLCGLLFLLPILSSIARWLAWSSGAVAVTITVMWANHAWNSSRPDYDPNIATALGELTMGALTAAFLVGWMVRYIVWLIALKREEIAERKMRLRVRNPGA